MGLHGACPMYLHHSKSDRGAVLLVRVGGPWGDVAEQSVSVYSHHSLGIFVGVPKYMVVGWSLLPRPVNSTRVPLGTSTSTSRKMAYALMTIWA